MDRSRLISLIDSLPQRRLISDATIDRWLARTAQVDPSRIDWHIRRARGFGGSEIGTLVRGIRGMPMDGFSTDREIIQGKLMLRSPDPQNGHTRRGTILEPVIRDIFLKRYNAKSRPDIVEAMNAYVCSEHPWLVGNPDELAEMPDKTVWVVDYKAPTPGTLEEYQEADGILFDYSAQLHEMQMIAERASGVRIAGRLLCSFDIMEGDIDVRFVEYDKSMVADILKAGDLYWNRCVMQGVVPAIRNAAKPLALTDESVREQVDAINGELVSAHCLATVSYAYVASMKERLADIVKRHGDLAVGRHTLQGSQVTSSVVIDPDEISRLLAQHDKTISDFTLTSSTGEIDTAKVIAHLTDAGMTKDEIDQRFGITVPVTDFDAAVKFLEAAGEDTHRCHKKELKVDMSRARKGPDFELLNGKKQLGRGVLQAFLAQNALPGPSDSDALVPERELAAAASQAIASSVQYMVPVAASPDPVDAAMTTAQSNDSRQEASSTEAASLPLPRPTTRPALRRIASMR